MANGVVCLFNLGYVCQVTFKAQSSQIVCIHTADLLTFTKFLCITCVVHTNRWLMIAVTDFMFCCFQQVCCHPRLCAVQMSSSSDDLCVIYWCLVFCRCRTSQTNCRANLQVSEVNKAERQRSISCWLTVSMNSSKGKLTIQTITLHCDYSATSKFFICSLTKKCLLMFIWHAKGTEVFIWLYVICAVIVRSKVLYELFEVNAR